MNDAAPPSEALLDWLMTLSSAADPAPWTSMVEGRDHDSGDSFIQVGIASARAEDMYVFRGRNPAGPNELDVIAASRTYLPVLVTEIKRLRDQLARPDR